jgi:ABC-type lipoprotein export system ATPase subunit
MASKEIITSEAGPTTTIRWPEGSIWRKWDLHCHTPASYDYHNKAVTDEEIITALKSAGVAAAAITDHHVIDVPRIVNLQKLAGEELTIFPGIELRTELGGKESVHLIGVFPEGCNIADVWTLLQGQLEITPAKVTAKTDDRVYVKFESATKLIHKLGGVVSVHAGKKSNSIEQIANAEEFKQEVKEDLARTCIDILEIGRIDDAAGYESIVFPTIGRTLALILCSDNHDARHYVARGPCWVRCDPSFEGLRQLLNEPADRVFRGDVPPILRRVAQNKTKYISRVLINKTADSKLAETWFDCSVPLNPGLIAIIGNKGSGKSALSDVIGLVGETRHGDSFSFLNVDKFHQPKNNKARHFLGTLAWESGSAPEKLLDAPTDPTAVETVKYIPQNYLETICNELRGGESRFDEELKSVIFSHVGNAERLGAESLDQLIDYRTQETDEAIKLLRSELSEINTQIASLETMLSPAHRKTLESQAAGKQRELDAHEAAKPKEVSKPDLDPEKQSEMAALSQQIEQAQADLALLQQERDVLVDEQKSLTRREAVATKLISKIENFKKQHQLFLSDSSAEFVELGLSIEQIVKLTFDTSAIAEIQQLTAERMQAIRRDLDAEVAGSLAGEISNASAGLQSIHARLDAPNQEYQDYLSALAEWERKRAEITGDEETVGSLDYITAGLNALDSVPERLRAAGESRKEKAKEIHSAIDSLAGLYKALYKPVQDFIEHHPLAQRGLQLDFKVTIVQGGFEQQFFELVSQGKKGSFCGIEEGRQVLKALLERADWSSRDGALAFLDHMIDHLCRDHRHPTAPPVVIGEQLKREGSVAALYDFLYSFAYLMPRYRLLWSGREIDELSPGERGTVLLLFYLLVDSSNVPLVIDQPEENLDNQTVFNILVPAIKEARQRRQIIIVTHNPNLAVVCDADQIIYAHLDKTSGNTAVVSGYKTRGLKHLRSTGKCFRDQYSTKLNKDGPSVSHGVF